MFGNKYVYQPVPKGTLKGFPGPVEEKSTSRKQLEFGIEFRVNNCNFSKFFSNRQNVFNLPNFSNWP